MNSTKTKRGSSELRVQQYNKGFFSSIYNYGWKPTNDMLLEQAERDLLSVLEEPYELEFVQIDDYFINTLKMGRSENPPIILIHGFGSGIGQWVKNLDCLSKNYRVYACDLLGFGRSSRPSFKGSTVAEAEAYFVHVLHKWIVSLGTGPYTLCAHSMGAYLASVYLLMYGDHDCKKLILADPWGLPAQEENFKAPNWRISVALSVANNFSPLSVLRAVGPYGPSLFASVRSDLVGKFEEYEDPGIFARYLYHVNAQSPGGEDAFAQLQQSFRWAREPLVNRLDKLTKHTLVFIVYGEETWMDMKSGHDLKTTMTEHTINLETIPDAGHHVMIDNHLLFNKIVCNIMDNY